MALGIDRAILLLADEEFDGQATAAAIVEAIAAEREAGTEYDLSFRCMGSQMRVLIGEPLESGLLSPETAARTASSASSVRAATPRAGVGASSRIFW